MQINTSCPNLIAVYFGEQWFYSDLRWIKKLLNMYGIVKSNRNFSSNVLYFTELLFF